MQPNPSRTFGALSVLLLLASCRNTAVGDPPAPPPSGTHSPSAYLPGASRQGADRPAVDSAEERAELLEHPPLAGDATLDAFVESALAASPRVSEARQRYVSASARVPQVTSWPDPILRARYFIEEVETRTGPQEFAIGLTQRVPWPGRNALRGDVAAAAAAAEHARAVGTALDVVQEVKHTWYRLFQLERTTEIVRTHADLLRNLEEVVRTAYASGQAPYADLLRAQVELERHRDRLRGLEDERRPLVARWNAALHRPRGSSAPRPETLPPPRIQLASGELFELLETWNPELRALDLERESASAGAELAEIARRPDLTFGIEYIATDSARGSNVSGSGDDPVIASLSFPLPLRSARYRAGEREARALERAVHARSDGLRDELHRRLEDALFRMRDAERRAELTGETLLPLARQALEAIETQFRSGSAGFLDLVDAERAVLDLSLSLAQARTDRAVAIAEIERLVGAPSSRPLETEAGGTR